MSAVPQQLSNSATQQRDVLAEDVVLSVRGVSKKFCRRLRRSMAYGIVDLGRNLLGAPPDSSGLRKHEFWAVQDISFELRRGEILGLIGPNGSGKTTLLRMIAGILPPDRGEIAIRGRTGALIALGAGFHPHMTGRENIYVNGAILGMSRAEIGAKFDAIVDFAEVGDALDAPVNSYSSGMRVRLGFAIAVHIDPDVLLIDEVLAVGDVGFRAKCYERMSDVVQRSAVVFVSHNMPAVARVCSRVAVLDRGHLLFDGDVAEGVEMYCKLFALQQPRTLGTGEARIQNLRVLDADGRPTQAVRHAEPARVAFDVQLAPEYDEYLVSVTFASRQMELVGQCHSAYCGERLTNDGRARHIEVDLPALHLNPGLYYVSVIVFDSANVRHLAWLHAGCQIQVRGEFVGSAPMQWRGEWSVEPI